MQTGIQNNQDSIDIRLFALINNDAHLVGTRNLEGNHIKDTAKFLRSFILAAQNNQSFLPDSLKSNALLNPLLKKLAKMQELDEQLFNLPAQLSSLSEAQREERYRAFSANIVETIVNSRLEENESLLMPGGWQKKPQGHAIAYEFRKDKAGNLIFIVYNSGAGLQYHQKVSGKDKKKYLPVKAYRIPASSINKEDLNQFITELIKPKVEPLLPDQDFKKNRIYDADRLYNQIFPKIAILGGEEIDPRTLGKNFQEVVTMGQRSGTCPEKLLHELIKTLMPDNPSAKLFLLCFKAYSIDQFLKQNIQNLDAKKIDQLKLAAENLSRIILKKHGNLPNEFMRQLSATIERINQLPEIPSPGKKETISSLPEEVNGTKLDTINMNIPVGVEATQVNQGNVFKDATPSVSGEKLITQNFTLTNFEDFIEKIRVLRLNNHHQAAVKSIEDLFLNLPLTEVHFQAINSPQLAVDFEAKMSNLLSQYAASSQMVDSAEKFGPKKIVTLLSVMSTYHILLKNRNIGLLGQGLSEVSRDDYSKFLKNLQNNVFLESYDPSIDRRLREIIEQQGSNRDGLSTYTYTRYLANHPRGPELSRYLRNLFIENGPNQPSRDSALTVAVYNKAVEQGVTDVVALIQLLEYKPGAFGDVANTISFHKYAQYRLRNIMEALEKFKYNSLLYPTTLYQTPWFSVSNWGDLLNHSPVFGVKWKLSDKIKQFENSKTQISAHDLDFGDIDAVKNKASYKDFSYARNDLYHPNAVYSYASGNANVKAEAASEQGHSEENAVAQMLWGLRSEPDLQILSTIDFYENHIELLSKPEHKHYLYKNIFQPGLLSKLLLNNPEAFNRINHFINFGVKLFSKEEPNSQDALYFLELKGTFIDYVLKMKNVALENKTKPELLDLKQKLEQIKIEEVPVENRLPVLRFNLLIEVYNKDLNKIQNNNDFAFNLFTHFMNYKMNFAAQKNINMQMQESDKEITQRTLKILEEYKQSFPQFILTWCRNHGVKEEALKTITRWQGNFPNFIAFNNQGFSVLALDLISGELQIQGKYLADIPAELYNDALFKMIMKEQPTEVNIVPVSYKNRYQIYKSYEVRTKDNLYTFLETPFLTKPYVVHTNKKINNQDRKYELQRMQGSSVKTLFTSELGANTINLDLPQTFFCLNTLCWKRVDNTDLLIEREDKKFHIDSQRKVYELNADGNPTGYVLSNYQDNSKTKLMLAQLFSNFEDANYTEIYTKSHSAVVGPDLKILFPRYGLELHGTFNKASQTWEFYDGKQPDLILKNSAMSINPPIKGALIFENRINKQIIAKIPNQDYYATEEPQKTEGDFPTVYFEHRLDTNLSVKSEMIKKAKKDEKILEKRAWKLINSETCIDYQVNQATHEITPANTLQSLHLAYLNLNHFKPEVAFNNLQEIIKKGLEGTEEELKLIEKIIFAAPRKIDEGEKVVNIENPRYLAVQLQALSLISHLHGKNAKFHIKKEQAQAPDSNSKLAESVEKDNLREFYKGVNNLIHQKMETYHQDKRNIPHFMRLSLSQEYELLKGLQFKNEPNTPLHIRWKDVKAAYLTKERIHILSHQEEMKLKKERAQQIAQELRQRKEIALKKTVLSEKNFIVTPPHPFKNSSEELSDVSQISYALLNLSPLQMPRFGMSDQEFIKNFLSYYRIAQSSPSLMGGVRSFLAGNVDDKSKLREFCLKVIKSNLYVEKERQTSLIPDFALLLLAVIEHPASFPDPSLISTSDPSEIEVRLNQLFKTANQYPYSIKGAVNVPGETRIVYEHDYDLESVPSISKVSANQFSFPKLDTPAYLKESKLEEFFQSISKIQSELEQQTQQTIERRWPTGKKYIDAAPIIREIDTAIGELRNKTNLKIQAASIEHLTDPNVREFVSSKTKAFINNIEKEKNQLMLDIIKLANQGPADFFEKQQFNLELHGGYRSTLTWKDLNKLYLMADMAEYKKATGLSEEKIRKLHQMISDEMNLSILLQSNQRKEKALEKCRNLDPKNVRNQQAFLDLGLALSEKNLVGFDDPSLQFFQKEESILINSLQKYYLNKLLKRNGGTGKYDNEVIQLIMGGGKSKVIGPVSAFKKANGSNLVIYQVKPSLLQTNHADLNAASMRLFGQEAILFKFDRNTNCTSADLKSLYRKIYQTAVDKNYLVTSGENLQSLELKYLELLDAPPESDKPNEMIEWKKQIKWLEKSLLFIKNAGDRIIDEYHDEIDPAKQLNYTIGSTQNPPKEDIDLEIDFFYFFKNLKLDNILNKKVTLFDLIKNNKLVQNPDVQWPLILKALAELVVNDKASPVAKSIKKLLTETRPGAGDAIKPEAIVNYLLNKDDYLLTTKQYKALSSREKEELSFLKPQLSGLLAFTLRKNLNEHYGSLRGPHVSEIQKLKAIPYLAKDTPNVRSNFGQFIESMNYTMQMNVQTESNDSLIRTILEDFISKAKSELLDNDKLTIDQTMSCIALNQCFSGADPISIAKLLTNDKAYWKKCIERCKGSEEFKKTIIKNFALPQNRLNPIVLSSNPQNMLSMTSTNQGMTGSPYNFRVGHQDMIFSEKEGVGTDGETIDLLKKKNTQVQLIEQYESPYEMLKEAAKNTPDYQNMRSIIDVGALFKKVTSNEEVAKDIARYTKEFIKPIKFVLYFDNEDGMLYALEIAANKKIKLNTTDEKIISETLKCTPDERFTYYDQARTVGTDITQGEEAINLLTIDEDTLENKFTQGAKRARKLHKQQKVVVIAPQYMSTTLTQKPTINRVTEHVANNQIKKLLKIHFQGSQHKFHNVARELLLRKLYEEKDPLVKAQKFKLFKEIFTQTYEPKHFFNHGQVSKAEASETYYKDLHDFYLKKVNEYLKRANVNLTSQENDVLVKQLEMVKSQSVQVCAAFLEKTARKHENQPDAEEVIAQANSANEVENELQNETETELEFQRQRLMYDPKVVPNIHTADWSLYNFKFSEYDHYWRQSAVPLNKSLEPYGNTYKFLFDSNIYLSPQFAKTHQTQAKILDVYTKPVEVVMLRQLKSDPSKLDAVILTKNEAAKLMNDINSPNPEYYIWMASPQETFFAGNVPPKISEKYESTLEQIRFFNGDAKLLSVQNKELKWCSKDTDDKLQFFQDIILPIHPTQMRYYDNLSLRLSVMNKIFKQIIFNPDTNFTQTDWVNIYPEYKKIPRAKQNIISQLAKASWEMQEFYFSAESHTFFDKAHFKQWLDKYPHEIRSLLEYRYTSIVLQGQLLDAMKSKANFDSLKAQRDLSQTDWNFMAPDGDTAFQKAILNKEMTIIDYLLNSPQGIKWEMTNRRGDSNISYLLRFLSEHPDIAPDYFTKILKSLKNEQAVQQVVSLVIGEYFKPFPPKGAAQLPVTDPTVLKFLLDNYISSRSEKIVAAIICNDPRIETFLKEVDPNLIYRNRSLLNIALSHNSKPAIAALIQNKANVNAMDTEQRTPLSWAVATKNNENVALLLEKGASVNIRAPGQEPLLFYAIYHAPEMVALLVDHEGTELNIKNDAGKSLLTAIESAPFSLLSIELVRKFTAKGLNVNDKDETGMNLLLLAASKNNIPFMRDLLRLNNIDLKVKDANGNTALMIAIDAGYKELTGLLLNHADINVNEKNSKGESPLFIAMRKGDISLMQLLLQKGAKVDEKDNLGNTPLMEAVKTHNLSAVVVLLQNKASIAEVGSDGKNVLFLAAEMVFNATAANIDAHNEIFKRLIGSTLEPTKINETNDKGETILSLALQKNRFDVAQTLLTFRADINGRRPSGERYLTYAVKAGDQALITFLLNNKADVNLKTPEGHSPLFLAAQRGDLDLCHTLLDKHGANINEEDIALGLLESKALGTILVNLMMRKMAKENPGKLPLFVAMEKRNEQLVRYLIEFGGRNINQKDQNGNTPLILAVKKGDKELVDFILKFKPNVNEKDEQGKSAFYLATRMKSLEICDLLSKHNPIVAESDVEAAIRESNEELAKTLLDYVCIPYIKDGEPLLISAAQKNNWSLVHLLLTVGRQDIHGKDRQGNTLLSVTLQKHEFDLASSYLSKGADINEKDNNGESYLITAVRKADSYKVEFILSKHQLIKELDVQLNGALFIATELGNEAIAARLIRSGAMINVTNNDGDTPLLLAAKKNDPKFAEFLLTNKADANKKNAQGRTPLFYAVENTNISLISILLKNRANINEADLQGNTPLSLTFQKQDFNLAQFLISQQANVNAVNNQGETYLTAAAQRGDLPVVVFLHDNKALIDQPNAKGDTPLAVAVQSGNKEVALFLLENGADMTIKNTQGATALSLAELSHPDLAQTFKQKLLELEKLKALKDKKAKPVTFSKVATKKDEVPLAAALIGANTAAAAAAAPAPVSKAAAAAVSKAVVTPAAAVIGKAAAAAAPAAAAAAVASDFNEAVVEQIQRIQAENKRNIAMSNLDFKFKDPQTIAYLNANPELAAKLLAHSRDYLAKQFNTLPFKTQTLKLNNLPEKIALAPAASRPSK